MTKQEDIIKQKHLSKEDIISNFLSRKSDNSERLNDFKLKEIKKHLLIVDTDDNAIGSVCHFCYAATNANPFRGCAEGVSISTVCRDCLSHFLIIHDFLFDKTKKKKQRIDLEKLDINFEEIEDLIKRGQARLSLLAKKYKISLIEMREVLNKQFEDKIEFRRGKGIVFKGAIKEIKVVDYNKIRSLIQKKQAKLVALAKEHNLSPSDMKGMLIQEFGDTIVFKKGRAGGIFFK